MIDDLEDRFLALFATDVRCQEPPDSEMGLGALCFGDQGIGGLLNTIVGEPVRALRAQDELLTQGLPETGIHLLSRPLANDAEGGEFPEVAEASELLQRLLACGWQAGQLPHHQVHDVVGVTLGKRAFLIP